MEITKEDALKTFKSIFEEYEDLNEEDIVNAINESEQDEKVAKKILNVLRKNNSGFFA